MRWLVALLLAPVQAVALYAASAQVAADTLPERVVAQAYDAFDRRDAAGFYSLFAPVWYHSVLEDTVAGPTRHVRSEGDARDLSVAFSAWAAKLRLKVIGRRVLGPYVVDEQVRDPGGTVHLDIFEVRHGKIVHEWESGPTGKAP